MLRRFLVAAVAALPLAAHAQAVRPQVEQHSAGAVTELHVGGPGSWGEVTASLQKLLADRSRAAGVPAPSAAERDALPPPLLLERGYRVLKADRKQGHYLIALAKMRMRWDGLQCKDPTAPQGMIVVQLMIHDAGVDPGSEPGDQADGVQMMKKILDEGTVFTGTTSPWWLCSNGLDAIGAGVQGGKLDESVWRISPAERTAKRKELEDAYRTALAKMDAPTH
jgi:hypothetical protein